MKYEIHIGKAYNADDLTEIVPLQKIIITEEQLSIIEMFAHQRKDENLQIIYKINDCEFTVKPHFDVDEILKSKK